MNKNEEMQFYHQKKITDEWIKINRDKYKSNSENLIIEEKLRENFISEVTFIENKALMHPFSFSIELDTMAAVSQGNAGRCWIVASLNLLREYARDKFPDMKYDLQLSEGYVSFYDKLEKANCFLEKMIVLRNERYDDRRTASWLRYAITDGGFWGNFKDLVEKYGVVPSNVFPETIQSQFTEEMNNRLNMYLRKTAAVMRKKTKECCSEAELRTIKSESMDKIFTFLCRCYGCPVSEFVFEGAEFTPSSFYKAIIGDYAQQFVNVISLDCEKLPYGKGCVLADSYGVIGGNEEIYLNLRLTEIKQKCIQQLQMGIPIVCVADDDKMCVESVQLWDDQCFDIYGVTGLDVEMDRTDIFQMKAGLPGHAWLITGVDISDDEVINHWKIENSYDLDSIHQGYCICSDSWFDKYAFSVLLHKSVLNDYEVSIKDYETTLNNKFFIWDIM